MIRRLLIAALLFASPVLAAPAEGVRGGYDRSTGRLLVTYDEAAVNGSSAAAITTAAAQRARTMNAVRDILNSFGVQYTIVPPNVMTTEYARIGQVTWGAGTSGAATESFDGVLIVNDFGRMARKNSAFLPNELTLSATTTTAASHGRKLAAVPTMRLFAQLRGYGNYGYFYKALQDSANDTTGVLASGTYSTWSSPGSCQLTASQYVHGGTKPYYTTGMSSGMRPNTTPPAGGIRYLVHQATSGAVASYFYELNEDRSAAWLDSLAYGSENGNGADTLQVWENMNATITGAKPIVNVYPWYGGNCSADTTGGTTQWPCEFDAASFIMGLARLDSLMGGTLIKKPLDAAVVITGAFSRVNSYRGAGGISPSDTSNVWVALDSLATLTDVPFTIGGNPDSVVTYASEIAQWKKLRNVRWTPWSLRGISDTSVTALGPGYGADPWGRYRDRPLAVGPYNLSSGVPQDTSLSSFLRFNRDSLARAVNGTPSGCAVAPFDDWTPKNTAPFNGYGSARLTPDSVLYAATRAGFSTLVYNAQRPFTANTMIGFAVPRQGTYRGRLSSSSSFDIKLLGHTGMAIRGSAFQYDIRTDSAMVDPNTECRNFGSTNTTAFVSIYNTAAYEQHRWVFGLVANQYRDYDFMSPYLFDPWDGVNTPLDDVLYDLKRSNIIRLSASDFGSGGFTNPTRPGWWSIKSLHNMFDSANALAGRRICRFVWPEDVQP